MTAIDEGDDIIALSLGMAAKVLAAPCTIGLTVVSPVLAAETLVMNGATASTDVRTLNGSALIKLTAVAKALGMILVKRAGGNRIEGLGLHAWQQ